MAEETKIKIRDPKQYKIDYLGLIQGNISRMAGNSALMKGFAATMAVAVLGLCTSKATEWYHIVIAILPVFAFVRLDVFYLQLEKRYRNLYFLVAEDLIDSPHFALDLKTPALQPYKEQINEDAGFLRTLRSVSVWQFYIWFFLLAIALIIFVI